MYYSQNAMTSLINVALSGVRKDSGYHLQSTDREVLYDKDKQSLHSLTIYPSIAKLYRFCAFSEYFGTLVINHDVEWGCLYMIHVCIPQHGQGAQSATQSSMPVINLRQPFSTTPFLCTIHSLKTLQRVRNTQKFSNELPNLRRF